MKESEIWLTLGLGILTVGLISIFYQKLLYTAFDEESARVNGVPVELINTILIILTAVTVSLSMRIVGVLLIGALMVIPVITAMQLAKSFAQGIFWSIGLALISVIAGLFISY